VIFTIDDSAVNTVSHLIQLSVAPVFLIAGVGAILGVFSQRLARIIDKVDKINTELQQSQKDPCMSKKSAGERRVQALEIQRVYLEKRSRNMNFAILLCTMTGFLVASVIMVLFLSSFFSFSGGLLIASLFILGMTTFMLALTLFLREIYMATHFMRMRG